MRGRDSLVSSVVASKALFELMRTDEEGGVGETFLNTLLTLFDVDDDSTTVAMQGLIGTPSSKSELSVDGSEMRLFSSSLMLPLEQPEEEDDREGEDDDLFNTNASKSLMS